MSKYSPHGVQWSVYKEGVLHIQGSSKVVAEWLGITPQHLRQIAYRKKVYKGVYTIQRKES